MVNVLGPWRGDAYRRAAMLDVLWVLGSCESTRNWEAGRDTTNPNSNTLCTEEAGAFQCSGDSMAFSPALKQMLLAAAAGCASFIRTTKSNHVFAIEYCARLLRITTRHHGR